MDEENDQILLKERYKLLEWTSSVELHTPNLLIPVQIANYVESLPFCKFAVSPKCDRIALMSYTRILDIYLLNGEILDHESSVQILEENSPEYCILQFTSSGQLLLSSRSTPHIDIFDSMGAYCYDIPLEPHDGVFDVNSAICAMQTVSLGTSADKYSEILYVLQYSGTFSAFKISRLSKYTKLWDISLEIGAVGTFQILPKFNLLLVSSHSNDTKNPGLCSFRMIDSYPYVEPIKISSTSTDSTWFFTWKLPFSTSSISFLPKMSVGEQFMISVSTSGSLFLFEIPSTRLRFAFCYINGPRPVEACFVDLDEIAIIYDNGVLLRCTIDEIEEKMFSMKIRTPEDLEEDIYPGQTMLQTPAHREIFLLSAEGDSSIFREAAHKRVQLAGQLWFYTVWNSLKKLVGMAMGESAEPLQMATHLARFEFAIHHSPTRTLQQLFDRTLIEHDYTRARELATSYDTIDIDIVLKSEWLEKSAQNAVKITDVSEILAQIRDLQWVLEQCITVNSESFEVQKALIELGLEIQEEDQDQLLHHQRILEVCNSDLEIYLRIRNRSILEAAIFFANSSDFELLYRIVEKNQECLRKHQRKILSAIPSCVYPTKYEHFLPKKHGEQWEIDLLQDHLHEKRNTSIWDAEGVAEDAEGWDFVEWIHETTRKIDFECGIIANSIGLLRLCAERGWHAELREEIEKWEMYAEYTRICASIAESLASFEKASVEDFVGRFGMLLESELINNASSIINLIEYKISQDPESEKISKIEKTMTNLMCQTNEKSTKVLAEFRRIRPDLISDRVVLECLMNMTTTGGDLLGNLTDFEGFLDYENITSALNSLMSRGVKMTFKAIFESMKEPDGAKRVLIKLSRSGHCENLEDWSLLRDDVLEMAEGIYGDLVTREEALELVAKEILESERPEFMDLVLTLNPRDPISDKKLCAKKSGEVLLSKSEDLMSEATHKDDPLLGKSRFFAISAREISGNPAKDQLRWLDAIELAQELGCTIMPIAIKFADREQLLHDLVHIGVNYKLGKKLAKLAVLLEIETPVATALSNCALAALNHNDGVYLGKYIGEVIRKTKGLAVVHQLCMRIILKEEYVVPVDMADIYSCAMNNCNEKNMMETLDAIAENERNLAENAEKHRKSAENLPICQLFTPDSMYCTVDCYKSKNIPKIDPKLYKKSGNLKKLMAYESSSLAMCLSLFQAENLAENQEFWTENEKLKRYEKSLRFFAGKGIPMEILTKIAPMKVINAANQNDRSLTAIDRIEDYGCDKNRFIGDRQYRDDAIVGLAMTENDQQFKDAIELAQKYEIDVWQLHMASLENAISTLPIPEVKKIIKNRQHLVKLRQNLDLFHATLRTGVLPLLGANEQFFAYCSLFSDSEVEKKAVGVVRKIVEKRKDARAPKMWQDAKYLAGILIGIPDKVLWSIVEMVQLIPVGKAACEIAARELLDGNELRPPGHPLTIWLLVGEDFEEFAEIVAVKAREDEIAYLKNALILLEATPKTPKILIEAVKDRVEKMERSTISPENQGFGTENETGMKMRRKN